MAKPRSRRGKLSDRRAKRRRKIVRTALLVIIIGEVAYFSAIFLPPVINAWIQPRPQVNLTGSAIVRAMLSILIDPVTNRLIDAQSLGLLNNAKPIILYIVVSDPTLASATCPTWPILKNASLVGIRTIVVVMPDIGIVDRPASKYSTDQFVNYVNELCGFSLIGQGGFLVVTSQWGDLAPNVPGYLKLITDLFRWGGLNVTNASLPMVIGVGPNASIKRDWILFGYGVNGTALAKLVKDLGT